MSGFIENRASEASERSGPQDRVLTWQASRAMLPLVGQIAQDVMQHHERLCRLQPEFDHLERNRRTLSWPARSRRYQLEEEMIDLQKELRSTMTELDALGVALLDPARGMVGFPTLVNERRAFFSWQPGEEGLLFWNYADDPTRHPVPASWTETPRESRSRGRSQRRKS